MFVILCDTLTELREFRLLDFEEDCWHFRHFGKIKSMDGLSDANCRPNLRPAILLPRIFLRNMVHNICFFILLWDPFVVSHSFLLCDIKYALQNYTRGSNLETIKHRITNHCWRTISSVEMFSENQCCSNTRNILLTL